MENMISKGSFSLLSLDKTYSSAFLLNAALPVFSGFLRKNELTWSKCSCRGKFSRNWFAINVWRASKIVEAWCTTTTQKYTLHASGLFASDVPINHRQVVSSNSYYIVCSWTRKFWHASSGVAARSVNRISAFMNKQYSNCFSQREIILADHSIPARY